MANDAWAMVVAVVVVLGLSLVLRWVFGPSRPRQGYRPVDAAESPDLGLLTVVAAGLDRQDALRQRSRLQDVHIRSSMSRRRDGRFDVLVFHGDADAARLHLQV